MPLDEIDERIVAELRANGRLSNARLAEAVGLSPSACLRRLHALEASGTILGYTAIVAEAQNPDVIVVIVQITLNRQTHEAMRRFEAALRKCADVRESYLMAGGIDYLVRVEAASMADYERIHADVLSRLPEVARIQSNFAIRSVSRQGRRG
jgi:DNA-binding Lrp family transcriptional regulator